MPRKLVLESGKEEGCEEPYKDSDRRAVGG